MRVTTPHAEHDTYRVAPSSVPKRSCTCFEMQVPTLRHRGHSKSGSACPFFSRRDTVSNSLEMSMQFASRTNASTMLFGDPSIEPSFNAVKRAIAPCKTYVRNDGSHVSRMDKHASMYSASFWNKVLSAFFTYDIFVFNYSYNDSLKKNYESGRAPRVNTAKMDAIAVVPKYAKIKYPGSMFV